MAEYLYYWIVGTVVGGVLITLNWRGIVRVLKGKKVAVLGERGVGKTHLTKFLSEGSISQEYFQTLAPTKISGRRFDLRELKLKLRETIDVPGDEVAYGVWKNLFDDADLVFYVFRVDKIKSGDLNTINRIKKDAKQIRLWIEEKKRNFPTVLAIGTFCDYDPEYIRLTPANFGTYQSNFLQLDVMKQVVQNINAEWWVLGSMKDIQSTELLAYRIFKSIQGLKK